MAASQMKKKNGDIIEWLFESDLKTEQQSLVFVKKMMAVAVSSIAHLRGMFPEDAFKSLHLEDMCIKVLREDCDSPGACQLVQWITGCFDALGKGYLQMVFIGVHANPGDPSYNIESYQFKFQYTAKGPQMDILRNKNGEMLVTMDDTKKSMVQLIRQLFLLMQNMGSLPNDVNITMRLYYYDAITPADYEPPGFRAGVSDNLWFKGTPVRFRVGGTQTAFHSMEVHVAAEPSRVEKLLEENYIRECRPTSMGLPGPILPQPGGGQDLDGNTDSPSEDEFVQFKIPQRPPPKRGRLPRR